MDQGIGRQKGKGMSWTKVGSRALALLSCAKLNARPAPRRALSLLHLTGQEFFEAAHLIPQQRGMLKVEVFRGLLHLFLHIGEGKQKLVEWQRLGGDFFGDFVVALGLRDLLGREHILDGFLDRGRGDTVLGVVRHLDRASAVSLVNGTTASSR